MNTIFALSTVFGKSGVAVFRISGSDSHKMQDLFCIDVDLVDRKATFVKLYDAEVLVDEVIVIHFKEPNSFTGENVYEIHSHGSVAVIKYITQKLLSIFRLADPGEFTRRAFLNDKFDLIKAEGIIDLINSETEGQIKQTAKQLSGELSSKYNDLRESIINILAKIEAYIDFPDEEIPNSIIDEIQTQVNRLIFTVESFLDDGRFGEKIREGFSLGIVGPPNSGKSTLLNYFAGKDLAIVTEIPGTTRDTIELKLDINGYPLTVIDTAGIRDTSDPIEKIGVEKSRQMIEDADIIIFMCDLEQLHSINIQNFIPNNKENIIYIVSKMDQGAQDIEYGGVKFSAISAHKGIGLDPLRKSICSLLSSNYKESCIITNARQRKALEDAMHHLKEFNIKETIELAAENLRVAALHISAVTGEIKLDDVLDKLFSSFCIGK